MTSKTRTFPNQLINSFTILPALLLISAAIAKAIDPSGFLFELADYDFSLPIDFEAGLALGLPVIEMMLGMLLLTGRSRRVIIAAMLLLLVFSSSILIGLPNGYLQRCGCLGAENLNPVFALMKNVVALLFLTLSLKYNREADRRWNVWGALAMIAGAFSLENPFILFIPAVALIVIVLIGGKPFFLVLLGLGLGLGFRYLHIPLLLLPILATFYAFIHVERVPGRIAISLLVSFALLIITAGQLVFPSPPQSSSRFHLNEPWPDQLIAIADLPVDDDGRSLVVMINPDCDLCRLWLPVAKSLAHPSGLPPLVGLAPGNPIRNEAFCQRERIVFPVLSIAPAIFERYAENTPLLLLIESGILRHAFPEGRLPTTAQIEKVLHDNDL